MARRASWSWWGHLVNWVTEALKVKTIGIEITIIRGQVFILRRNT
jgi:hypothetical protein